MNKTKVCTTPEVNNLSPLPRLYHRRSFLRGTGFGARGSATKRRPRALLLISISRPLREYASKETLDSIASPKLLVLLISLAVLALPTLLMAQAGTLDLTFGINGIVTTANTGANAAALQSDGKIVVAGSIATMQNG